MHPPWPITHLLILANMVVLSIPIYVCGPFERRKRISDRCVRAWMASIFRLTRVSNPTELQDRLPGPGPYIVMSNHQSHLDVALLVWRLPLFLRFIAKRELLFVPVFGFTMWVLGHITIDRRNRVRAIRSLELAARKIRAGTSVLVFPEGTRNAAPDDGLLPFKKGGLMLAIEAGVPILPIAIAGTELRLPKGSGRIFPGPVCFRIGEPIVTGNLTPEDRNALAGRVRLSIEALRKRAVADLSAYEARGGAA